MPSVAGDNSVIMQSLDVALKKDLLVLGAISDGRALPNEDGASKGSTGAKKKPAPKKPSVKKKSKAVSKKKSKKKKTPAKKKKAAKKKRRTMAMAARAHVIKSALVTKKAKKTKAAKGAKTPAGTPKSAKGGPPQPKRAIYTNPKAPKVLMVRAAAIGAFDLIGDWEQEMLKYGQAIIHDKIVVIDPLSDNCVVITGSHNLGYKASYANDENLLIIKGNRALATVYMVHILDVQDHYKFRAILEQQAFERATGKAGEKPPVGKGILDVDGTWQDKYFTGTPNAEQAYFLSAKMPS
jgi:phosphatidylserine/phosphatidylglycerophosphate/cardiolipin synthase-like enzyme